MFAKLLTVSKGDAVGHPFRGNQWHRGGELHAGYKDAKGRDRSGGLDSHQRKAENAFYTAIERNKDALIKKYQAENGNVIDADRVKELSPDFAADKTNFAGAVHEPSSALSKMIFSHALDHKAKTGDTSSTIFTAGGSGSGKSAALPIVRKHLNIPHDSLVFDSVLGNFKSASNKIDEALSKTKGDIVIAYTNRSLEDAYASNAKRDRSVLTKVLTNAHISSSNNLRKLAEHYKDNPRVKISVVNNLGGVEDMHVGKLSDVPTYDEGTIKDKLHSIADKLHSNKEISDEKHAHIKKSASVGRGRLRQVGSRILSSKSGEDVGRSNGGSGSGIEQTVCETLERPRASSPFRKILKGDFAGHPFRGNQYTSSGRSSDTGRIGGNSPQGTDGSSALPLREDGKVELTHWSNKGNLGSIDPSKYGTAYAGVEKSRKDADPKNWVDRSYHGIGVGQAGGYIKESGLGMHKYTSGVDPKSLYDFAKDPANLVPKGKLDASANPHSVYEKAIKESGHAGYWLHHDKLGKVAAMFHPVTPEKYHPPVQKHEYLRILQQG